MIDYKKDFPFFKGKNGSLIYLDSAATTQRLQVVIDAMNDYYVNYNASVHRAVYALGETATTHFEQVRLKVAQFINAASLEEIIFTSVSNFPNSCPLTPLLRILSLYGI